jgi:hypothetical protein
VIVISKKLFCLTLIGLASLAIASVCALFELPMSQAVMLFLLTWIALVALFEIGHLFQPRTDTFRGLPKHE